MTTPLAAFLIAPILLVLLPVVIPVLGKLVVDLVDKAVGRQIPKKAKPFVALTIGLGAGVLGHYAGIGDTNAQLLAALGGPGAIAANETWNQIRPKTYDVGAASSRKKIPQAAGPGDEKTPRE